MNSNQNQPVEQHPDATLTLRETFEKHYDKTELRKATLVTYRAALVNWEKHTDNPPVNEVVNQTMDGFKKAAIEAGLKPASVNNYWRHIRAIFRRLAPAFTGNPTGLEIIERVPYMKLLKCPRKIPRRVSMDEFNRFYLACSVATIPHQAAAPAPAYWRALIVLAYTTGLRKGDLFNLRETDIDLEKRTVHFTAQKTGSESVHPLTVEAVTHIAKIISGREFLFARMSASSGRFTLIWREILEAAGIERFTLHDIRRTAASEIERVRSGMGRLLLQHAPKGVTETHYLNMGEELADAVREMNVPVTFKQGVKHVERELRKARDEHQKRLKESEIKLPEKLKPDLWDFYEPGYPEAQFARYSFRGQWKRIGIRQWWALREFAMSDGPVTFKQLYRAAYQAKVTPDNWVKASKRINTVVHRLRRVLRNHLGLDKDWNPFPCIKREVGGVWALFLPSFLIEPDLLEQDSEGETEVSAVKKREMKKRLHAALLAVQKHCPHCGEKLFKKNAEFDRRPEEHRLCCKRCNADAPKLEEEKPDGSKKSKAGLKVNLSVPVDRWNRIEEHAKRQGIPTKQLIARILKQAEEQFPQEKI